MPLRTSIVKYQHTEDVIILSSTTAPKEMNQSLMDYLIENDNDVINPIEQYTIQSIHC